MITSTHNTLMGNTINIVESHVCGINNIEWSGL